MLERVQLPSCLLRVLPHARAPQVHLCYIHFIIQRLLFRVSAAFTSAHYWAILWARKCNVIRATPVHQAVNSLHVYVVVATDTQQTSTSVVCLHALQLEVRSPVRRLTFRQRDISYVSTILPFLEEGGIFSCFSALCCIVYARCCHAATHPDAWEGQTSRAEGSAMSTRSARSGRSWNSTPSVFVVHGKSCDVNCVNSQLLGFCVYCCVVSSGSKHWPFLLSYAETVYRLQTHMMHLLRKELSLMVVVSAFVL